MPPRAAVLALRPSSARRPRLLVGAGGGLQSRQMPAPAFIPTELEWRTLAHACRLVAARERERAAGSQGAAAMDYLNSAQEFERLAAACLRMTRADP